MDEHDARATIPNPMQPPDIEAPARGDAPEMTASSDAPEASATPEAAATAERIASAHPEHEHEDATATAAGEPPETPAPLPKRVPAASDEEVAALRRRAKAAWDNVVAAHASGDTVLGTIVSTVKGGMLVDIAGIRGFLPASQIRAADGATLDSLVKTVVPLKVLDLDASRRRAVVSARKALESLRREKRAALLTSLAPGQRRTVVVVRLTDFGAFVDLGGVDGLIPMSELALERIDRASDVVSVGDELEVEVLRVDENGKKISLSRKNALPDPWRDHAALLKPGNKIEGKVVAKEPRLSIEIAPGIVGTMRDSDADPADYEIGETVEVTVRSMDRRSRRIVLTTPYAATASLSTGNTGFASLGAELQAKRRG